MSHVRARRIFMKWERLHQRYPQSGAWAVGPERFHNGHLKADLRVMYSGRYAPIGVRDVWRLGYSKVGA